MLSKMAVSHEKVGHKFSHFNIDFVPKVDKHGRPDDRFMFQARMKPAMSVKVAEMAGILNGLFEIERMERDSKNTRCFAFSKEIDSQTRHDHKYLMATRIGEKLDIKVLEFDPRRREEYLEFSIDLEKDDIFDLASYVLRTLNYYSEHLHMFLNL
jgi:hypothetical protein